MTARWEMDLSPGMVISPFNSPPGKICMFIVSPLPSVIPDRVAVVAKNSGRLQRRLFFVKLDSQGAFFKFAVMYDADILDTDAGYGQNSGNGCDGSGFVDDIAVDPVCLFDRAGRGESE